MLTLIHPFRYITHHIHLSLAHSYDMTQYQYTRFFKRTPSSPQGPFSPFVTPVGMVIIIHQDVLNRISYFRVAVIRWNTLARISNHSMVDVRCCCDKGTA
jgi:hypothetical protein